MWKPDDEKWECWFQELIKFKKRHGHFRVPETTTSLRAWMDGQRAAYDKLNSEGIHELSDDECLELATSARIVLVEMSNRIETAYNDDDKLKTSVTRLLKKKQAQVEKKAKGKK